ncbi:glutamyl-tRNA reductase-binding protein, chloroplastic isoform X2 [Alnus glutinosa]|uniref:glutamyl-tRNA reductase-binding protein, chloroplastic isoform X2 n=1 Tax=Alnus glutinosa TaxID=3517 RepID=UPI002D78DDC9|nr:glutamyl-tRNA reductase-binding protein, chloroplastic isoform X2 [Alnus glutinosa]
MLLQTQSLATHFAPSLTFSKPITKTQFTPPKPNPFRQSLFRALKCSLSVVLEPMHLELRRNKPFPAEVSRTIMELASVGTLSTLTEENWPLGIGVRFAVDEEGTPVLCLNASNRQFSIDKRSSLHVQLEQCGLRTTQCTIQGSLDKPEDRMVLKCIGCFLNRFWMYWVVGIQSSGDERRFGLESCSTMFDVDFMAGEGQLSFEGLDPFLHDVSLLSVECWLSFNQLHSLWKKRFGEEVDEDLIYVVAVERVLQIENFEDCVWVTSSDYKNAQPDPLRDFAEKLVNDINTNNMEDVNRFCNIYVDLDFQVSEAKVIWVDRLGFDMRLFSPQKGVFEARVPFPSEVMDEKGAKSTFNCMSQLAWEVEKNFHVLDFQKVKQLKQIS